MATPSATLSTLMASRGHVRKRGKGWEIRAYAGKGRYITRVVHGSEKHAKKALTALLAQIDTGQLTGPDAPLSAVAKRWQREASWSPSTEAAYRHYLNTHILPALGDKPVGRLSVDVLDGFYRSRLERLAPSSVQKVHGMIRRMLGEAVRWGWLASNPAERARPPKASRPEIVPPEPEDVDRLLKEADSWLRAWLVLASRTGARRGELAALRWANVDFERAELVIDRAIVHGPDGMMEKPPKSGRPRRLALGPQTMAELREHRSWCEEYAAEGDTKITARSFVFSPSPDGLEHYRPDGMTARFAALRKRAGLEHVRLHDLRHFVVTQLLGKGVPAGVVADRVGHTNAATTLNLYRHWMPAADREAAELLD